MDAKTLMKRAFWTGLLTDVVLGICLTTLPFVVSEDFVFSTEYFAIMGAALAKTGIHTILSYVIRHLKPDTMS